MFLCKRAQYVLVGLIFSCECPQIKVGRTPFHGSRVFEAGRLQCAGQHLLREATVVRHEQIA